MTIRTELIRTELMALKDDQGFIVPERAVAWAKKNSASALHRALEWDDKKAGHQFRLWQVRRLISISCLTIEGGRQIVSLSIDRSRSGGGYRDMGDILPAADLRQVLLDDALAELDRVQEKYASVQELAQVWIEKEKVRTTRRGRKPRSDSSRPAVSA